MIKVSVIIPTLNEEKYLPSLLQSLENQTMKDFEIIVADSDSKDNTRRIAKYFGVIFLAGKRKGPAEGRNRGAKEANSNVLLFVDADCILPPYTLQSVLEALEDPEVVGGSTAFMPLDGNVIDSFLFGLANLYQKTAIKLGYPHNAGYCFFFRKGAFECLGGIREDLRMNETHDIALRSRNLGNFVFLPIPIFTSMRRFHTNGYKKTVVKEYLASTVHYYLTKGTPSKIFSPKPVR